MVDYKGMKNFINSRWLLMEYLNACDMYGTNADIAKYLYENHDKLLTQSLNKIASDSYFSQSSLSRFFKNVCGASLDDYRKGDAFGIGYIQSYLTHPNEFSFDLFRENLEKNITFLENNNLKLKNLTRNLETHNRVLFLGNAQPLNTTYSLQSALVYYNHPSYAPYNYLSQEKLASDFGEGDMIIGLVLDEAWVSTTIAQSFKQILSNSNAYKVAIVPNNNSSSIEYFDESIVLDSSDGFDNYMSLIMIFEVLTEMFLSECYCETQNKNNRND